MVPVIILFSGPAPPMITNTSEEYGANNVTIILEWAQEKNVLYNISIVPQIPIAYYIGSTSLSVRLTVLYNTEHNMSVEAALPCQNQASSHLQLFYGELS